MSGLQHLPARAYVAMPMDVSLAQLPRVVREEFDRVAALLASRGIAPRGAVIRYVSARPDGTFSIEVGHLVDAADLEGSPIEPDILPEGEYSVARHEGPYSGIGEVTRALMDSWGPAGVAPASAHTTTGDDYASWYELYLDMPREGPEGPEGAVEICVLTLPPEAG
ncbi:GyrI-like domain-containing protein [Demequina sp. SYSU T00192]|uniref:GyrI-like domain-containing protein n=1 Tax=Demequina litoralis TaxID=3051660 RepID=A0ABT8GBB6_9MICO|nr:GyrI-like domain-containing protein [Demequina sp. SYSU T00192]MDN4476428.1 GyrI-like domain-containing protein [Demequina sp. SYSU T00192]